MKDIQSVLLVSKEKSYSLNCRPSEINSFWWAKLGGGRSLVVVRYIDLRINEVKGNFGCFWLINNIICDVNGFNRNDLFQAIATMLTDLKVKWKSSRHQEEVKKSKTPSTEKLCDNNRQNRNTNYLIWISDTAGKLKMWYFIMDFKFSRSVL